ncbi:hypothetical protein AB0F13_19655 [Streptomyces sp. NPDC026206]|uniref:hypothetical protein n=1 Tax=Streptomyces sp. NPDC026206 TaxID=3157089 RepID=UPI0033C04BFA
MSSMRSRLAALVLAAAVGGSMLGLAPSASADDHPSDDGLRDLPVLVVSPAPGKITREHKITDTYQYNPTAGSSADASSSAPSAQSPASQQGVATSLKDTANSAVQSATSGASSTVGSALT